MYLNRSIKTIERCVRPRPLEISIVFKFICSFISSYQTYKLIKRKKTEKCYLNDIKFNLIVSI